MEKEEQKSIWRDQPTTDMINGWGRNTIGEFIGLRFSEIGADYMKATLPHSPRVQQPYGFIHGGVNVVLAETLGSVASAMVVDRNRYRCVGVEVNANHLRSVTSGTITGTCRPLRLGRTLHVWQIDIHDEMGRLTCTSRLTVAIVPVSNFRS